MPSAVAEDQSDGEDLEYRVKAAMLLSFTRYVEWPQVAFPAPDAPIVVCVLGSDPFGSVLDDAIRGRMNNDRALVARRMPGGEGLLSGCHVVFLPATSDGAGFQDMIGRINGKPVLTVGESSLFLDIGGIIRFVRSEEDTIQFEVNLDSANRAGIRISSRMLSLATKVKR